MPLFKELINGIIKRPVEVSEAKLWREFISNFSNISFVIFVISIFLALLVLNIWGRFLFKINSHKKVLKVHIPFWISFVIATIVLGVSLFILGPRFLYDITGVKASPYFYFNLFFYIFVLLILLSIVYLLLTLINLLCPPKFKRANPIFKWV